MQVIKIMIYKIIIVYLTMLSRSGERLFRDIEAIQTEQLVRGRPAGYLLA